MRDTKLWVVRSGTGPLVVALHGGPGLDHTYLRPWLDPLADQHELVYVDLRGQGRSQRVATADWSSMTHAPFVADLDALRAHLGHQRMVLIGHSYGAHIALDYALTHPDGLDGLVLIGGAPVVDHGERIAANALARGGELGAAFLHALASPFADDATFEREFPRFLPLYFRRARVPAGFMENTRFCADALNWALTVMFPRWNVTERLPEIAGPVLVMTGEDDFIAPRDPCANRLMEGLPCAMLDMVPRAGHFAFADNNDYALRSIRSFLATLRRGTHP